MEKDQAIINIGRNSNEHNNSVRSSQRISACAIPENYIIGLDKPIV